MKKLIPDYLQYGLPANENFLQYINEEMNSYLTALCSTLFPDSEFKAYIISGITETILGFPGYGMWTMRYEKGMIFFNNEFLMTPVHHIFMEQPGIPSGFSPGLVPASEVIHQEYADGNIRPAYERKWLSWADHENVTGPLAYYNLVRIKKYPNT